MELLATLYTELESLTKLKVELEERIDAVKKSIRILEPKYAQMNQRSRLWNLSVMMAGVEKMGITEAVQWALRASPEGLSPTEVRDLLAERGHPMRGDNPMATVHTVLKRLASRADGSVIVGSESGRTVYRYVAQAATDSESESARAATRERRKALGSGQKPKGT